MAWTTVKQTRPANTRHEVYSEVVANDQDKTFTVATDGGANYVIRPRFIEIVYAAAATAGLRTLTLTMTRATVDVMTLLLNTDAQPDNAETKRIFLVPGRDAIENNPAGALDTHLHTMPRIVLGQGDSLNFAPASGGNAADDMTIHIHAEVFSDGS